ncbi:PREDICTED: uncharacterized protein LOC104741727 isoform X2 [Camelina sativa]|uniref:Uncharacterized protein LOC104741725 isoform X2 n=1 Tax=Camelina sativa TaxID=90675 RepID=A0ABM1QXG0_CAMSA|nr:PREDICTED: uncharacterized protein LOC104741725 isoform X2 [Camelina sativa]XP_019091456.1 PREDICTED: uncharacterized protein LOC104741727 isoform X2 [Camelina sativa]
MNLRSKVLSSCEYLKIRTRTRRAMRAGRKFNRHQIYGFCFDNWSDTLRRMEWKKPYCSPALMYCCRPPAENNWKIPKRLIPCKEPCNFCECAGLQRNRSKEPKKGIEATFATTVNKGKWILSNPHFGWRWWQSVQ